MPNDRLVQLAQAYIEQPLIQIGYKVRRGGLGTVMAIVILQPIEIAQANTSMQNRNLLLRQSSLIQLKIPKNKSFICSTISMTANVHNSF